MTHRGRVEDSRTLYKGVVVSPASRRPPSRRNPSTYATSAAPARILVSLAACLLLVPLPLNSKVGAGVDNTYTDALWVTDNHSLRKLAMADGAVLVQAAGRYRELAIDPERGRVWASGDRTISGVDFDGDIQVRIDLAHAKSRHAALTVDPTDGSLWAAFGRRLFHYGLDGELIDSMELDRNAIALGVNAAARTLWVATEKGVSAYTLAGELRRTLVLAPRPKVNDLAVDTPTGDVWVTYGQETDDHGGDDDSFSEDQSSGDQDSRDDDNRNSEIKDNSGSAGSTWLRHFAESGELLHEWSLPHATKLAPDGHGGLWAASRGSLYRIDAYSGLVLFIMRPFDGGEAIDALVAHPRDGSVWVASAKLIRRITADSLVVQELSAQRPPLGLAAYADATPPTLRFAAPAADSYVNRTAPTLELTMADDAIGTDASTLRLESNGEALAVSCTPDAEQIACIPDTAFPNGPVEITASVADLAGNRSVPAVVSFTVDTIFPEITSIEPPNKAHVNDPYALIRGRVSEWANVSVNELPAVLNLNLGFEFESDLHEGANTWEIVLTDDAGNQTRLMHVVVLDTLPPQDPNIERISATEAVGSELEITGQAGSVEPDSIVLIENVMTGASWRAESDANGAFGIILPAGENGPFKLSVLDRAGNRSSIVDLPGAETCLWPMQVSGPDALFVTGHRFVSNRNGAAIIAWLQFGWDGDAVWASRLGDDGCWQEPERLSNEFDQVTFGVDQLRVTERGDVLVAWWQRNELWFNVFDVEKTAWRAATPAPDGTALVTIDTKGEVVAISFAGGDPSSLMSNSYGEQAGWGSPQAIPGAGTSMVLGPSAAVVDKVGNITVAFLGHPHPRPFFSVDSVWLNRFVADAGWRQPQLAEFVDSTASGARVDTAHPLLGVDALGNVVAIWEQGQFDVHRDIWSTRFVAGEGWAGPTLVGDSRELDPFWHHAESSSLAVSSRGDAVAVWTDNYNIWAARYAYGDDRWAPADRISSGAALANLDIARTGRVRNPDVAIDDNGRAVAAWEYDFEASGTGDPTHGLVVASFVPGPGWGGVRFIKVRPGYFDDLNPKTAITRPGMASVAWEEDGAIWVERVGVADPAVNLPPVASAGENLVVDELDWVMLSEQQSYDPDGYLLASGFVWTQTAGPRVVNSPSFGPGISFRAPQVDADTTLRFELVVHDVFGTPSVPATVSVTIRDVGPPDTVAPVVLPPVDLVVEAADIFTKVDLGVGRAIDDRDGDLTAFPTFHGRFDLGTTTVTWQATDRSGNVGTAVQSVTVRDTTPPVLHTPADVEVESLIPAYVAIGTARATDVFPVTVNSDAPTAFPLGTTIVTWTAIDTSGNRATSTQRIVVREPRSVTLTVSSPSDGAITDRSTILVEGIVMAPRNTGVTVNGQTAAVDRTVNPPHYYASIPLALGVNSINVTATSQGSQSETRELTVTRTGAAERFSVAADRTEGIAPLDVTFEVLTSSAVEDNAVYTIHIDFDGDGAVDLERADYDVHPVTGRKVFRPLGANHFFTHAFDTPGVYRSIVEINNLSRIDPGLGNGEQAAVVIEAMDVDTMDPMLTKTWNDMNEALLEGDVTRALSYLTIGARKRYRPVFEGLVPHFSDIVASYGSWKLTMVSPDLAEYAINRSIDGGNWIFFVYFLRDIDGVWRIEAM